MSRAGGLKMLWGKKVFEKSERILAFLTYKCRSLPGQILQLALMSICAACVQRTVHGSIRLIATGRNSASAHRLASEALGLIQRTDPRRFRRIEQNIRWVVLAGWKPLGVYLPLGRVCGIRDFSSAEVKDFSAITYAYAYMLIHESVHGTLDRKQFAYTERNRRQIERICHAEAARFFRRLHLPEDAVTAMFDILKART